MQEPHELHWKATKRILRYVKGTPSFGIFYAVDCPLSLIGYKDSDCAGDGTDCNSTSGYVFSLVMGHFSSLARRNPQLIYLQQRHSIEVQ